MTEHDHPVADAERAGGVDVFEIAAAQEFRPHHADQRHPGEQPEKLAEWEKYGLFFSYDPLQDIEVSHYCFYIELS